MMGYFIRLLALSITAFVLGGSLQTYAQGRKTLRSFQGQWVWATHAKRRSELPPAYRNMKVRDVPQYILELNLKQQGQTLTGEYAAGARFLAKVENGEISATVNRHVAQVELESGHGGKITARLMLLGNRLYWKVIKAEGEHYFPDDVALRRVDKKPSAR
jgi:hypothetical protein